MTKKKKHKHSHSKKHKSTSRPSTGTGSPVQDSSQPSSSASGTASFDQFGVIELFQTKAGGTHWYLNSSANNKDLRIHEIKGGVSKKVDRGFNYFTANVAEGALKSGGKRYTFRMDVRASGERDGSQKYNYQTGAISNGYCENANDIGDCEFTFIGRRSKITGQHVIEFALRGGDHHDSSPDSSCVACMYPTAAQSSGSTPSKNYNFCFEKELIHAVIDTIKVPTKTSSPGWPINTWIAVKAVSYVSKSDKSEVTNRIYYDSDPIDFTSNPPKLRNKYTLLAEYVDKGEKTGNYTTLVNWAGCTLSIRIDNAGIMDFAAVSIRSIVPTTNPTDTGSGSSGGTGSSSSGSGGSVGNQPPPPPPGTEGSGGTTTTTAIISKPKATNFIDSGGKLANPLNIWFIFWGSYWNTAPTAPAPAMADINTAMNTVFNSYYFDALYQYRFLQSPVIIGTGVNTTFAVKNLFTVTDMMALIDDTKTAGTIPVYDSATEDPNYLYIILPPPGNASSGGGAGSHDMDKYMYAYVNPQADLPTTTRQLTKQIVNAMTDNKPVTGIVINPKGAFANQTGNGHEVVSICDSSSSPTGIVQGVTVAKYWSDQDNICIAKDSAPNFISCPVGYNWDKSTQTCVSKSGSGGSSTDSSQGGSSCCDKTNSGSGGGGGKDSTPTAPAGSSGNTDLGTAGQGGGSQPEGQPILTVSKDWTFLLNVGVDTDDSCTKGNPLEIKPFTTIYDVSPDTSSNVAAWDDLGYAHGDGVIEIGQYVNTTKSALYNQAIRQVVVKALKRLIDTSGATCAGLLYCQIYNYPTQKIIIPNFGTPVDVASIDVNDQTLTFTQLDNTYRMQVGDIILIHYQDDSSSADKAIRVRRTSQDTFDSVNSFYAVRAESGYLGNSDNDAAFTIMI